MNIVESFKSFNEQHNNQPFMTADDIVAHLDKTCPDWKGKIQDPGCWKEVFEFPVHIFGFGERVRLATILFAFSISLDMEAEESVFASENVNEGYRFAAAFRLLRYDPEGFLEQYKEAVRKYKFSQSYVDSSSCLWEIFNFPGSVEFAISMCNDEDTKAYALDYLVQVLDKNWEQYPDDIKKEIMDEHEYCVRKHCTQQIWKSLSESEKFILAHHIVVNEYNYVRDVMSLYEYLTTDEGCKLPIITPEIRMTLDDIRHHQDRFSNRDEAYMIDYIQHHISGRFYQPTVDYEQMRYNPSEQLLRFQQFAETSGDTIIAKELQSARREIEHSFLK